MVDTPQFHPDEPVIPLAAEAPQFAHDSPVLPLEGHVKTIDEEPADHGLSQRQKLSPVQKALSPITSYPETYRHMRNEAQGQVSEGVHQMMHPDSLIDPKAHGLSDVLGGAAKTAIGAAGFAASPISAAYRSIVGQPIEDVTGIPREYPEFAAQLATPGIGLPAFRGTPKAPPPIPKPAAPAGEAPFSTVLTEGEKTGDLAKRQAEQGAFRGQAGKPAQEHAENFLNLERPQQLAADKDMVLKSLDPVGKQELAQNPAQAAELAQQSLQKEAARSKSQVKSLYDQAKALPGEIHADTFTNMPQDIKTSLSNRPESVIIDDNTPIATRMINYLDKQIGELKIKNLAQPQSTALAGQGPAPIVGVNLEGVEQWRKNLSRMRGDAIAAYRTNPSDTRAANAVINEFDQRIADAVNSGAFRGDPRAVDLFNQARAAHSERMKVWGNDPIGRKLQSIIGDAASGRDPASLNDVANFMYSASGTSPNSVNVGVAKRIKNVLGESSPEWAAIRQGLLHRLISTAENVADRGAGTIANRIGEFINGKGSDLASVVFTQPQRDLLNQYAELHRKLSIPQVAANWPNTAAGIIPHIRAVTDKVLGAVGAYIGHHILPVAGGFAGWAAGEKASSILNAAENARNLRQIAQQMPLLSQKMKVWQEAVKAQQRANTVANQSRKALAATNVTAALGKLGINDASTMRLLRVEGPGTSQADENVPKRADGGAIDDSIDDAPEVPPKRLYMNMSPDADKVPELPDTRPAAVKSLAEKPFSEGTKIGNRLTGLGGEERYQTWPERMIRSGATLPHDVMTGKVDPTLWKREDYTDIPYEPKEEDRTWFGKQLGLSPTTPQPSDEYLGRVQDMAGMAGSGGLGAGVEGAGAALGSAPFLRPALKYQNKIYKAPEGGQHLDALPPELHDTFHKQAMSGEDISNFNFGFMNHKGQFLDREKALDYAVKEGLIDPHAANQGALTSTILEDSATPGAALSALEHEAQGRATFAEPQKAPEMPIAQEAPTGNLPTKFQPEALQSDVQNFLKLAQTYQGKLGDDWISKLTPEQLQSLKAAPAFAKSLANIDAAKNAGVFNKILETPIDRRTLFSGAGVLATTISNASKLATMMERISPPAPIRPSAAELFGQRASAMLDKYNQNRRIIEDRIQDEKDSLLSRIEDFKGEYPEKHEEYASQAAAEEMYEKFERRSKSDRKKFSDDDFHEWLHDTPGRSAAFTRRMNKILDEEFEFPLDEEKWQEAHENIEKKHQPELDALEEQRRKELQDELGLPKLNEKQKSILNGIVDEQGLIRRKGLKKLDALLEASSPQEKAQIAEHIKPALLQDSNLSLGDARTIAKAFPSLKGFALFSDTQKPAAALSALEKQRAPEMKIETAPNNLPQIYKPLAEAKPEISKSIQDFVNLSRDMEKKYNTSDWVSRLTPEDVAKIKADPKYIDATNKLNGAALEGAFTNILNQPVTRRSFLTNTAAVARLVASSGKLGKMLEAVAPKEELIINPPQMRPPLWNELSKISKQKITKDFLKNEKEDSLGHGVDTPEEHYDEMMQSVGFNDLKDEWRLKEVPDKEEVQNPQYKEDKAAKEAKIEAGANLSRYINTKAKELGKAKLWLDSDIKSALEGKKSITSGIHTTIPDWIKTPEFENLSKVYLNTLRSDSSAAGAPLAALEHAQPFYSAVEKMLQSAPQSKMHGEQWANWLKNQPGVKPDELQYTGIDNWLREQKGPVNKQQVTDFIDKNKVQVNDVVKGGDSTPWEELSNSDQKKQIKRYREENGLQGQRIDLDEVIDWYTHGDTEETKYSSYQLPGGENYREHLITLPRKPVEGALTKAEGNELQNLLEKDNKFTTGRGPELTKDEMKRYEELYGKHQKWAKESTRARTDENGNPVIGDVYKSSHWDEPNVLAHVRTNDRDVGGVPALHMEELQSDWASAGRKKGFKAEVSQEEKQRISDKDHATRNEFSHAMLEAVENHWGHTNDITPRNLNQWRDSVLNSNGRIDQLPSWAATERVQAAAKDYYNAFNDALALDRKLQGVPDAPFIRGDKPYELAMKRMIAKAIAEGKSRVSWTPGEAQAARYDLSKQIDKLTYDQESGRLLGTKDDATVLRQKNVTPDKLADYVGKEAADKLMKLEPENGGARVLKNADLKVGGEGMREFYDQMLPKMVEKLGKQYGVKVKQGESGTVGYQPIEKEGRFYAKDTKSPSEVGPFQSKQEAQAWIDKLEDKQSQPVHYFDIPEKMKQDVLSKGFPLFSDSSANAPLSALEHNSKLENLPWQKNPNIGWWKDQPNHLTMYLGTHKSNVSNIVEEGIRAPSGGPTAGKVSMAFDPYTAHGYASMSGESAFRAAGANAKSIPHQDRRVLKVEIPKEWANENVDQKLRGNVGNVKDNLKSKEKYETHKKAGGNDHEYYATTELRFNKPIPPEFIKGVMQRVPEK